MGQPRGGGSYHPKMLLEEKDFRRVDKFEGDPAKFRGWIFDVFTALNHVDSFLAADLHGLLARDAVNGKAERWEPGMDLDCDHSRYVKYHGELFGILSLLTSGEAKTVLREMSDAGETLDGYRVLGIFQDRYGKRTSASMLRSYLDVVTPSAIKGVKDVVSGIHKWEGKVTALGSRHGEHLNGKMKLAILIGMIPKEFQDMVL